MIKNIYKLAFLVIANVGMQVRTYHMGFLFGNLIFVSFRSSRYIFKSMVFGGIWNLWSHYQMRLTKCNNKLASRLSAVSCHVNLTKIWLHFVIFFPSSSSLLFHIHLLPFASPNFVFTGILSLDILLPLMAFFSHSDEKSHQVEITLRHHTNQIFSVEKHIKILYALLF